MSDERSDATEEIHESESESAADDAGGVDAPGGGPRRVVSDQSVDDILESLDSTRSQGPPASDDQETEADSDSTDDEAEATRADPAGDADARVDDDADDVDSSDDETEPTTDDGLAARVESGTVTGSDVRAAEAGEGREPTPDVGEIDLSLDDLADGDETDGPLAGTLEDAGPETSEGNPATGDDSVDEDGNEDEDEDGGGSGGLLGRIRRFFS